MMSFKTFITETEHKDGTYINVKPSESNKNSIYSWVISNNIDNPLDKKEYHVTLIYSRKPCPDSVNYEFNLPFVGKIIGWKIFDAPLGRCLVAHVESDDLQRVNKDIRARYGATSDYPDYIPHITVSYNYSGELPTTYPDIELQFVKAEVKGLNKDWKPD